MTIERPAPAVVVVRIRGTDVGDLRDAPFRALAPLLEGRRRVELFVDARDARGPSVDVGRAWAGWLIAHRDRLRHASMLASSRMVQLTAGFVRRFAGLDGLMRIYTEPAVFDGALSNALGNARRPD